MTDSRDVETVERTIPQPADAIFAFLANPRRHREIDGSGALRDAKEAPERVKLGGGAQPPEAKPRVKLGEEKKKPSIKFKK